MLIRNSHSRSVGWFVGRFVGQSVGRSVGRSVGQLVLTSLRISKVLGFVSVSERWYGGHPAESYKVLLDVYVRK